VPHAPRPPALRPIGGGPILPAMPGSIATALLLAHTVTTEPGQARQGWDTVQAPTVTFDVLPRTARVEVDGKAQQPGLIAIDVADPQRTFRVRVSAEGFEPEEAVVVAGKVATRQVIVALRPAGYPKRVDAGDAASMALAAAALWRAQRVDDAAAYAEQSLQVANTDLANRVLGDVWRHRGNRGQATKYYTMYLSLVENPKDGPEIRAWLMQDRPGDITIPAR
jgi:hypothetical protein